ncbi:MAG: diguanylate cyclase [Agathobacter sp.]|nr:diguanylate cyclase [Agathobacter sp.]
MSLGIFVGFGILFMAVASVALGINIIRNAGMQIREKNIIFGLSLFAFLWCAGYGFMTLSETVQYAHIGRTIGLIGVYCFIVMGFKFFIYYCGANNSKMNLFWKFDWLWAFSCIFLLAKQSPQSVIYVKTVYGTSFYSIVNWIRYYALFFIGVNFFAIFMLLVIGRIKARFTRQKKMINILLTMELVLILASIPDGVMPSLNRASFPASCIGVFIVMIMVNHMAFKYNAFSLTKESISRYIYESIAMPVILFDENHNVLRLNSKAEEYFDIERDEEVGKFDDLFEITDDDTSKYICNIIGGLQENALRVVTKKTGLVCELSSNVVLDDYGEFLCGVIFINDLTKEYKDYEQLQELKGNLEKQLEEKTKQMEDMTLQTISTIANFIDSKEAYTIGHSTRVAKYSELIAKELGWTEEEIINVHYVGLLHDIGKIGISHTILNKRTNLTDDEYETIKKHTIIGGEILRDIKSVEHVEEGALYHHEHYDGSGYPFGLKKDEIPLIARVIGIADAYDAMTSNRKYRKSLPKEVVYDEIKKGAGKQFDPYISSVVLRMLDEGILTTISEVNNFKHESNMLTESNMLMAKVIGNEIINTHYETENDYLTQIWNRSVGEKKINEYLQIGDGALIIIDMDNFNEINSMYSHEKGDEVLQMAADILRVHAKNEFLCRLGGDEFMMFFKGVDSIDKAKEILEAIYLTYNSKLLEHDEMMYTSFSMGVALSKFEGRDYENLFRCADRALYYVKQNGKHTYSFHNCAELDGVGDNKILNLNNLVDSLKNNCDYAGAFKMEYGQFLHVHEFIEKYAMRNQQCVQLVLMTIDYENSVKMSLADRNIIMEELDYSVTGVLRGVDVCTRFSNSQLLVTLVDTEAESIPYVVRKLLKSFYRVHRKEDVKIDVESADITVKGSIFNQNVNIHA